MYIHESIRLRGRRVVFVFAIGPFPVRIGELIEVERKGVIEKLMRIMVENHACSVRFK